MTTMVSPMSPHSPRPTRVASYALHFQIPILPMPTPPSLLKRQSSSSSASWSSASSTPSSSSSSAANPTHSAASVPSSTVSSAGSTPLTTPLPRMAVTPASPMVTRSSSVTMSSPSTPSASWHRRSDSAPSASSSLPTDVPYTPYSTPLDSTELSFPAFSDTRPPILRRDTPRPGTRSRHSEVDEFEAEFGRGLGFDMSN